MTNCTYTKVKTDSYGADWITECGRRVRCEAPIDVGMVFPPLPNKTGKFCHYCGKRIEIKGTSPR